MGAAASSTSSTKLDSREKVLLKYKLGLEKCDIPDSLVQMQQELQEGVNTHGEVGEHVKLLATLLAKIGRVHTLTLDFISGALERNFATELTKKNRQLLAGESMKECMRLAQNCLEEDTFWDRHAVPQQSILRISKAIEQMNRTGRVLVRILERDDPHMSKLRPHVTLHALEKDGTSNMGY